MSNPFSVQQLVSRPSWSGPSSLSNMFVPFPQVTTVSTDEVGYGEGGYGIGGYDAPSVFASSSPRPNWTVYTGK